MKVMDERKTQIKKKKTKTKRNWEDKSYSENVGVK